MLKLAKYVRNCFVFWENLHSWQKFYMTAGRDKFQVWSSYSLIHQRRYPPNLSRSPRKISTNIHQRRYLLISIKEDIYKYPAKKISTNLPRSPPWCRWLKETLRALLSAASCSRRRSASPSKGETCLISIYKHIYNIFIWFIFQSVTFNNRSSLSGNFGKPATRWTTTRKAFLASKSTHKLVQTAWNQGFFLHRIKK